MKMQNERTVGGIVYKAIQTFRRTSGGFASCYGCAAQSDIIMCSTLNKCTAATRDGQDIIWVKKDEA